MDTSIFRVLTWHEEEKIPKEIEHENDTPLLGLYSPEKV